MDNLSDENRQSNSDLQVNDIHINEPIQTDVYFGGLLNRSDSCCIKCFKIISAIIFLPIVLLYKLFQSIYRCFISFCQNQCYRCLIWLNDKIEKIAIFLIDKGVKCLEVLSKCCTAICNFLYSIIRILGRCSKCILDTLYNFTLKVVLKVYLFRAFLQELSSCISVPITIGILVPLFLGFHKYIYHPIKVAIITIIKTIYKFIKYMVVLIYTHIIVNFYKYVLIKFLWELILTKLIWEFILIKILFELLIVNIYKILKFIFVNIIYKSIKFIFVEIIYKILLTYLWKFIVLLYDGFTKIMNFLWEWIIIKFIWEIICINSWKGIKWISDKIYLFLLLPFFRSIRWIIINFYKYTLKPLYRLISFILNDILFQRILTPIYRIIKYILIDILYRTIIKKTVIFIYRIISKMFHFFYYSILQPLWNIIKITLNFINTKLILPLFSFFSLAYQALITLGTAVWGYLIHCLQLG